MTYNEFIQDIINTRGQWNIPEGEYYEAHHIIPKCMGGLPKRYNKNTKHENIIWLYPEEHYNAHKLLAEENPQNYNLVCAWNWMLTGSGNAQMMRDYTISETDYARAKHLMLDVYKVTPRSAEFKQHVSAGMNLYRQEHDFTKEHLQKIRETTNKHKEANLKQGLTIYGTPIRKDGECGAAQMFVSNNREVYCVYNSERYNFKSMREGGIWWHKVRPLTEKYSEVNYQRRIRDSANSLQIKYKHVIIDYIKWYWKEGDSNEKVD